MKRSGTYSTKSRQEIMKYLEASAGRTVSASDILDHLQGIGLNVSPTTVYRNLDRLCEEKKILKYVAEKGEKAVYQLEVEGRHCADHLHLKCLGCGKIIHMDCDFMDEVREHLMRGHGFSLQCEGTVLYGYCEACRKKKEGLQSS